MNKKFHFYSRKRNDVDSWGHFSYVTSFRTIEELESYLKSNTADSSEETHVTMNRNDGTPVIIMQNNKFLEVPEDSVEDRMKK